jgi:hypothetical protein
MIQFRKTPRAPVQEAVLEANLESLPLAPIAGAPGAGFCILALMYRRLTLLAGQGGEWAMK